VDGTDVHELDVGRGVLGGLGLGLAGVVTARVATTGVAATAGVTGVAGVIGVATTTAAVLSGVVPTAGVTTTAVLSGVLTGLARVGAVGVTSGVVGVGRVRIAVAVLFEVEALGARGVDTPVEGDRAGPAGEE
jgi:hypothetical protein